MKLIQKVTENCYVQASVSNINPEEQGIVLMLPDVASDKEKTLAISRTVAVLIQEGWVVGETQELNHMTSLEFIKNCDARELCEAMLVC